MLVVMVTARGKCVLAELETLNLVESRLRIIDYRLLYVRDRPSRYIN